MRNPNVRAENHCKESDGKLRATRVPTQDVQSAQVVDRLSDVRERDVREGIIRDNQSIFLSFR